jgi:3-phenylpropionate/trans-cinnamate dioxygenase ferredoxin reductase subunit
MEYVGPGSGDPIIRGSMEEGEFIAFYVDEGQVKAALSVGRSDDLNSARSFISERTHIDPSVLSDPGADLAAL